MGTPLDQRLVTAYRRQTETFRRGTELMRRAPELLEIPFEGSALPGYFFRTGENDHPSATVILTGGYDGTAEELYFANGAAALARGYNVLVFDGPGQGAALIKQGLTLGPRVPPLPLMRPREALRYLPSPDRCRSPRIEGLGKDRGTGAFAGDHM